MSLNPGDRLGPYEIVGLLGAGGMGDVYRARDPRLGRDVAIKVQRDAAAGDADHLRRFELEARAASLLNHPNVIAIYDVGSHHGRPFVVTELLEGATLRDKLRDGPLPAQRAVDWGVQIVRGLAAAHRRGIVHRDLKPENIFITRDGLAKLLDFGIAKLKRPETPFAGDALDNPTDTAPGAVLGSVGYMSPEQARGLPADHRSDLFSTGGVLYEMLSGRRAFGGASAADTVSAILHADPPPLALDAGIPTGLQKIIRHCLEKDPDRRFQSADDLLFALENVEHLPVLTPTPGRTTTDKVTTPWRGRGWWSLAAVAVIAALVIGVVTILTRPMAVPNVALRVAGGPAEGVYSAIATGLVELFNAKIANITGTAIGTAGGFQNLKMIDEGQADLAITQNDIAFHAVKTARALGHRSTAICGLAVLYGEAAHIVVNSASNITRVEDLKGHGVNLGMRESGSRFSSNILLQHFGVEERDLTPDYRDFGIAVTDLPSRKLDAAISWRALPIPVLPDLYKTKSVRLLSLNPALIQGLQANQPFWTPLTIPAGTYPGQAEPVTTIAVKALLVGSCALGPETVGQVLGAMFDGVPDLIAHHQRASEISLRTASRLEDGMSIDLHPAAEQFYKQRLR